MHTVETKIKAKHIGIDIQKYEPTKNSPGLPEGHDTCCVIESGATTARAARIANTPNPY